MKGPMGYAVLAVTLLLCCSRFGEEKEPEKSCLPSADLVITNSSEYLVLELYAHTGPVYIQADDKILIVQNMGIGAIVQFPVDYGDAYYFTFIRKYFSTSTIDIAVTSEKPVTIENCSKYSLYLLEEDFYLEKEDNIAY